MISQWLGQAVEWSVQIVQFFGYQGIVFMMFLESSFIPFPSELVMPQAGILASRGEMNIWLAILMGIVGSWLGALLNYYLALRLGRPFFMKYGRYLFCPPETFAKVEKFFVDHGEIGTFTGRLVPVIRQYISLPAGLGRMNMGRFLFFTGLGSGLWVTVLAFVGKIAGDNKELIKEYSKEWTIWLLAGCAVLIVLYAWWHRHRRARHARPADTSPA
jgi:membrane protein DedA with SNARE-associated domain